MFLLLRAGRRWPNGPAEAGWHWASLSSSIPHLKCGVQIEPWEVLPNKIEQPQFFTVWGDIWPFEYFSSKPLYLLFFTFTQSIAIFFPPTATSCATSSLLNHCQSFLTAPPLPLAPFQSRSNPFCSQSGHIIVNQIMSASFLNIHQWIPIVLLKINFHYIQKVQAHLEVRLFSHPYLLLFISLLCFFS